ncbi:hypothetical protein [Streptomyces chiangmaiensis]|uniref:Uncharacterized protein n=1 Tax=Streptomyces chiangmaiensis TaxID=766497 RepID=A0ABU7FDR2_9ACTN|nr:hypothetical protein [Streptomyces chiangmaiensis]MED7822091.1 hypothetical protein [Streptomyces chiangmaiensis]
MSRPEGEPRPESPGVTWSAALHGAVRGRALGQTTTAALTVGSILFMVNLYSQLVDGPLTWAFTLRVVLTFLVPWLNATLGLAIGLRKAGAPPRHRSGPADTTTP